MLFWSPFPASILSWEQSVLHRDSASSDTYVAQVKECCLDPTKGHNSQHTPDTAEDGASKCDTKESPVTKDTTKKTNGAFQ